jgi:hypothetical protein
VLLSQLLLYNDLLVGNQGAAVAPVAALLKRKNDKEKKNISPPSFSVSLRLGSSPSPLILKKLSDLPYFHPTGANLPATAKPLFCFVFGSF